MDDSDSFSCLQCWCHGPLVNSVHPAYHVCSVCGTLVSKIPTTSEGLEKFYSLNSYWHKLVKHKMYPPIEVRAVSDFGDRIPYWLSLVSCYSQDPKSMLEIGCAHGGFLALCRQQGIETVVGIEVDEETCRFAREHFKLPCVISGLFPNVNLPLQRFDLIVSFDVIQHFSNPLEDMAAIARLLSPDGTFIFQTPCYCGEDASWRQFKPEEHLYLFNADTVKELFKRADLEITEILPGFFPGDMFLIGKKTKDAASVHNPDTTPCKSWQKIKASGGASTLNIVFFTHYTALLGANRSLLTLVEGLALLGHRITVFCPQHGALVDYLSRIDVTYHIVPFPLLFTNNTNRSISVTIPPTERLKTTLYCATVIADYCKSIDIDIVYTNSSVMDIGLLVALLIGRPHIWHIREFGDLDYNLIPDVGDKVFSKLLKLSQGMVFISEAISNYYKEQYDVHGKVIYNGIYSEAELYSFSALKNKVCTDDTAIRFALAGYIHPKKGYATAIQAFAQVIKDYPDAILIVAGDGQTAWLEEIIRHYNVQSNVQLVGFVENISNIFLNADVMLMCSENEAFGRVTIEAMACGALVIGRNSGATSEIIADGHNGLLYDGTVVDLTAKMKYIAGNRYRLNELSENGRNTVRNRFLSKQYIDNIAEYIQHVSQGHKENYPEQPNGHGNLNTYERDLYEIYLTSTERDSPESSFKETIARSGIQKKLLPKITIITPSLNQAEYLEECIESVLEQGYPNLEYVIMDGGSTDGSVEIIKKYEKHLTYWQSCPDGGLYQAVTEGFRRTSGEIMAWINSDDKYHPLAFTKVAAVFSNNPDIDWLTGRKSFWDASGNLSKVEQRLGIFSRKKFLAGDFDKPYIQQESTFWRRSLWEAAGGCLAPDARLAGDLELWLRFFRHAQLHTVDTLLGGYRFYGDQRGVTLADQYYQESLTFFAQEKKSLELGQSTSYFPAIPKVLSVEKQELAALPGSHAYPNHVRCWAEYTEDLLLCTNNMITERRYSLAPFWLHEIELFCLLKPRAACLLRSAIEALGQGWKQLESTCYKASAHEQAGRADTAATLYREGYDLDPGHAPAVAGLLRCLQQCGNSCEALGLLPSILSLHAHDGDVVAVAVTILSGYGALEQALGVCQEFVSVNPHDERILQLLEHILQKED